MSIQLFVYIFGQEEYVLEQLALAAENRCRHGYPSDIRPAICR
jgi:hypothetical protein